MPSSVPAKGSDGRLRFDVYEADPRSGELRKGGVRISLEERPFRALLILLSRANELVTREELKQQLWSSDTFVDFDHGLNTAIRKIRLALNDRTNEPRFIETVGRRGYRFLAAVEQVRDATTTRIVAEGQASQEAQNQAPAAPVVVDPAADESGEPDLRRRLPILITPKAREKKGEQRFGNSAELRDEPEYFEQANSAAAAAVSGSGRRWSKGVAAAACLVAAGIAVAWFGLRRTQARPEIAERQLNNGIPAWQMNQNKPDRPTYTQVDYPGAVSTRLSGGPNLEGTSVGTWTDTSGVTHGCKLTAQGAFTSFDPPGSTYTIPAYINLHGDIAGLYHDSRGISHGFVLKDGHYTTLDYPRQPGTSLTGVNDFGEIAGFYCSTPSCAVGSIFHSFVVSKTGVFTNFDPPHASGSYASTVNELGAVVGSYSTESGGTCTTQCEGYLFFNGNYTAINPPGSVFTVIGGNNLRNNVVGFYLDASGKGHGFLLSNGAYKSFDYPGAALTQGTGISDVGVIVGVILDSSGNAHGFIRTP